jgi:hypothetical protein
LKDRKPQNSALLIATIGVYLGLVLAGAAPQVLANAALTKQFNVRDEIEFKDDLDNKPDDPRSPVTASVKIYLEDVEFFLASIGRLQSRGDFDLVKDTFEVSESTLLPCVDSGRQGRFTPVKFLSSSEHSRPALEMLSRGMMYGYSLGDCIPTNEFSDVTAADSKFAFKLDKNEFSIQVAVKKDSPQRAIELQRELATVLAVYAGKDPNVLRKTVIQNTVYRATNNQVFIVLSLPRASLPSLLSEIK